ncbi:P-loop containing nucleoside triphosphate hydrolase protein [Trametopsis cervina]|nr:P-loop containing nucleoside triphosphate hydrolase protein [Trametopsis cervina]
MRCLTRSLRFDLRKPLLRLYTTAAQLAPAISLRPYQESCLEACTDALKSGVSRIGVSLPTGSGKTTVFITLLSLIQPPVKHPNAKRSLVIVNSVELALQAAAQTNKLFPEWTVELEQGHHQATGEADLTVATYQTLLQPSRLAKFDPATLKAIIVDEAHHAAAPSYRRILSHFHTSITSPDKDFEPPSLPRPIPIFGFSATFSRHDGLALGSVFERIVYHRDFLEMIKEQWLCNVRFTSIKANIDLRNVTINSKSGDFNATSLAHVINTPSVNKLVVQAWLDRAATRKSTLVFCVNIAHLRELTNAFREAGVDARYIHAGTPAAERKDLIRAFRAGEFPVLLNCAILTEGADIPNIDCVVVAKPTRSRNIFAQMIGRGMRLSPNTGKEDCHIIDFVDSMGRVAGLVSIPHLFGLDPTEIIDNQSLEELEEKANQALDLDDTRPVSTTVVGDVPAAKSITYIDYDDPFSLVHGASGAPHIAKLSRNAWVGCGGNIYVLECLTQGYIRVEPIDDSEEPQARFRATFVPTLNLPRQVARQLKLSPFQRSKKVLDATNLEDAIKGSDIYASTQVLVGHAAMGMARHASWRHEPATANQKELVRKRWYKLDGGVDRSEDLAHLTKGEAANIITRLKHGAHMRFEKKMKIERRTQLDLAREERRRAREHVSVGPLSA